MKLYKGTLNIYGATGEGVHYYCNTGDVQEHKWENHLSILESDVVEVVSPDRQTRIIIHYFPKTLKELKTVLTPEGLKTWKKAAEEKWNVEVVRFETETTYN